jgi:hypothetical protein
MAIPATADPTGLNIRPITGGRWEATCGKCLKTSIPVLAVDAAHAWVDLQALGWIHYVSDYGGSGYCICKSCAQAPAGGPTAKKATTPR